MAPEIKRPRLSRRWRLGLVVVHILSAAAWIGVDVIVAVLVAVGQLSNDVETQSLAYRALATFVVWPMLISALVCLISGLALGLGTKWGLVRYWWVAVKLVLNLVLCTLIWFALRPGMPGIDAYGEDLLVGTPDTAAISSLAMPPTVSLTALTIAVLLSVFKPWGRILNRTANAVRPAESGWQRGPVGAPVWTADEGATQVGQRLPEAAVHTDLHGCDSGHHRHGDEVDDGVGDVVRG